MRYADVPASAVNAVTAALSVRFREVLTLARCDLGRELAVEDHRSSRMALTICCPNTDCDHELFSAATARF